MSNETSTTNIPRKKKIKNVRKKSTESGRYRKFSCISYLSEEQLKVCLIKHINQIRVYAYAFHDKDVKEDGTPKEPHFHLLIVTYNTCTLSAIRRWFWGYLSDGKDITTTSQKCTDVFSSYDYLTHNTIEAKAEGKYQYESSIIKTNDKSGYFQASEESEFDNITLATEMLLKGAKTRDLGKMFGRDFILHYGAIRTYLNDIYQWESHPEFDNLGDIIENEFNMER